MDHSRLCAPLAAPLAAALGAGMASGLIASPADRHAKKKLKLPNPTYYLP